MRKIFAVLCLVTLMTGAVFAETENLTIDGYSIGREYILTDQTLPIYQTAEKFTGPVCLIHGTADRIVPYTYSEHYNRLYRNSELHLLPGADHGFTGFENIAAKTAADFLVK